jgi:TolB-like protein
MASATALLVARRGPELDSRRVAVAAFENQTGDSTQGAFGRILTESVTNALAQTGLVQVVDGSTKQVVTARLKSSMSPRELAKLVGAARIVSGAYYRDGDSLRIQASLIDTKTGRILRTVSPVSVPVSAPLRGIDAFRQRLMGTLAIQFDPHFSQWTEAAQEAPTYDAYREFVAAVELYSRGELNDAIPQLSKASALDPNFHLARLWIAEAYISLDSLAKADSVLAVVNASRDQLGRLERAVFDYRLAQRRNDQEATLRYARQAAELWPDRYLLNAALEANLVDHFHEAEQLIRRIDPDRGFMLGWRDEYWGVLTDAEHALGEYEQELEDARRGRKQYPESPGIFSKEIRALVALGRVDEAVALLGVSGMLPIRDADPWWPWHVMLAMTAELRAHRQPSAARQTAESALAWLESRSVEEQATAQYRAALCEVHYLAEHWRDALAACAQAAARQPPDPEALGRLVSLAGRRGDTAEVERLFLQAARNDLRGSPRIANEADSRARIAALRGERAEAVRLLKGLKGMFPSTPGDFWFWLHTEVDFDSLRDSPSFQELTRPKE